MFPRHGSDLAYSHSSSAVMVTVTVMLLQCGNVAATCSVCHGVVRGLYVWCQGCLHGGHLHHMRDWITANRSCPAGCGHLCEYT